MSMIADANEEGYSAVSALMKEPSGSFFPRKSMWFRWEQRPANVEILSAVGARAQVLKMSSPHLQAGVATK